MFGWDIGWSAWWMVPVMVMMLLMAACMAMMFLRSKRMAMAGHFSCCHAPREDSAADTLRQRYARGELNQDEFENMRQHLGA
jgi:putative membrane protein